MQTPNQGMSVTPMNPQGYPQQPPSAQQHFPAPLGTTATTAPSTEAEPPVPGTEDAAAAKAPAKAAPKPSYSAAPVLRAAATPAAEGAPQQVCIFTLCPISANFSPTLPVSAVLLKLLVMNHWSSLHWTNSLLHRQGKQEGRCHLVLLSSLSAVCRQMGILDRAKSSFQLLLESDWRPGASSRYAYTHTSHIKHATGLYA